MFRFLTRCGFILGFLIGIIIAYYFKTTKSPSKVPTIKFDSLFNNYEKWLINQNVKRDEELLFDTLRYDKHNLQLESDYLYDNIKVLCLVLVKNKGNFEAVQNTWAKGCTDIKSIDLSVDNKRKLPIRRKKENSSWALLCQFLKTAEKHEWVLIVYDYTFVITENLRLLLAGLNASEAHYLGHTVRYWNIDYNMGQAGYVLSQGALGALRPKLIEANCTGDQIYFNQEDYYLGKLLKSLNIYPSDTRDENQLTTFHPYNLYHIFFPGEDYYRFSAYPAKCCSKKSIAFQGIEGDKMYLYHYLIYKLQIFRNGNLGNKPYKSTEPDEKIWHDFLISRNITRPISNQEYYEIWEKLIDDPTSFARNLRLDYD